MIYYLIVSLTLIISNCNGQTNVKLIKDTFEVTWHYKETETDFTIKATIDADINNAWIGFGFNQNGKEEMDGADVIICTNIEGDENVKHYLNTGYSPDLLDPNTPTLGITNGVTTIKENVFTCSYTRKNTNPTQNYYDFKEDSKPALLAAFGQITNGKISRHIARDIVSFSSTTTQTTTNPQIFTNLLTLDTVKIEWWFNKDQTYFKVTTELNAEVDVNNAWLGIGFNDKKQMDKTNAVVCKSGSQNVVQHYYNDGYSPILVDSKIPMLGITNSKIQVDGPILKCTFTRDYSNSNVNYYDINNPAYLMIAYGTLPSSGEIQFHDTVVISDEMIKFSGNEITTTIQTEQTTTSTILSTLLSTSSTVVSTSAIKPANGQFSVNIWKLNYIDDGEYTDFVFETRLSSPDNTWSAFAFSTNKLMGGDNVCMCKYTSAAISSIENYVTDGRKVSLLDSNQPKLGFSNEKVVYDNGVLQCSFRRLKTLKNVDKYYDLNEKHYILVASGPFLQSIFQNLNLLFYIISNYNFNL
jgi:hypothetical protein